MPRWAWITIGIIAALYVINDPAGAALFVNTVFHNIALFGSHVTK